MTTPMPASRDDASGEWEALTREPAPFPSARAGAPSGAGGGHSASAPHARGADQHAVPIPVTVRAGGTATLTAPAPTRTTGDDAPADAGDPATRTRIGGPRGPGGSGGAGGSGGDGPVRRPPRKRPNYALRRTMALAILLTIVLVLGLAVRWAVGFVGGLFDGGSPSANSTSGASPTGSASASTPALALAPEVPAPTPSPTVEQGAEGPADKTSMVQTMRLASASMSPKSVVASPTGLLVAQNMMYHHSISVFTPDGALLKTIPDTVTLSDFGIDGHPGESQGAPVEAAFTPDGKYAWISNYSMYGEGFGPEGEDSCSAGDGTDTSYVYRVNTETLAIDKVVPAGAVPKYVAITPDGKTVLVTNWCSWDLTVIDAASGTATGSIDLGGRYPRGIAVAPDSSTAYVALMGSQRVASVNLKDKTVSTLAEPGNGPRHIVESPDGKFLYVTNNTSGTVVKLDRATGKVLGTVSTGSQPRSMAISTDGLAIYVVNYGESSMSKVATADMTVLQTVKTDANPIGITYEPTTRAVWVACYGGSLLVFDDSKLAG